MEKLQAASMSSLLRRNDHKCSLTEVLSSQGLRDFLVKHLVSHYSAIGDAISCDAPV